MDPSFKFALWNQILSALISMAELAITGFIVTKALKALGLGAWLKQAVMPSVQEDTRKWHYVRFLAWLPDETNAPTTKVHKGWITQGIPWAWTFVQDHPESVDPSTSEPRRKFLLPTTTHFEVLPDNEALFTRPVSEQ